jgi:YbbR domain-containing protein
LEAVGDAVSFSVGRVTAEVRIEEIQVRRDLDEVPIEVRDSAEIAELSPTTVRVTVRGPRRMVAALTAADLRVFADAGTDGAARLSAEVPAPAELVAIDPKIATLRLVTTPVAVATPSPAPAGKKGSRKEAAAKKP